MSADADAFVSRLRKIVDLTSCSYLECLGAIEVAKTEIMQNLMKATDEEEKVD